MVAAPRCAGRVTPPQGRSRSRCGAAVPPRDSANPFQMPPPPFGNYDPGAAPGMVPPASAVADTNKGLGYIYKSGSNKVFICFSIL